MPFLTLLPGFLRTIAETCKPVLPEKGLNIERFDKYCGCAAWLHYEADL